MPTYRLTPPTGAVELLEADSARVEGIHLVLRGTALVIGSPREIVVRRVPRHVHVEEVPEQVQERPSWAVAVATASHSVVPTNQPTPEERDERVASPARSGDGAPGAAQGGPGRAAR